MDDPEKKSYRRVDMTQLSSQVGDSATKDRWVSHVRWTVIPLSVLLCVVQAIVAIMAENTRGIILTPTLISVVALGVLFVLVLVVNPLMRLAIPRKILRPLGRAELVCIFTALLITSGISTFGLTSQLIPIIATPWNAQWNTVQRGWEKDLLPSLNPKLYISVPQDASEEQAQAILENIQTFRGGLQPVDENGTKVSRPAEGASWSEHSDYWQLVFQQIPWSMWVGPLAYWMIFIGACYGLFYALTYVALGYWDKGEKLIFPLAKLPQMLLPESDDSKRWLPPALSSPGFWIFFALSAAVLGWNGVIDAEWLVGLNRINLGIGGVDWNKILQGTLFEGLSGKGGLITLIIFTAIGVSFLLPTEISFSIWFYYLIGKLIILSAVWMGYGQTHSDFPSDFLSTNNPVTAQGAGAVLIFSVISLYRCVRDYLRLCKGKSRMRQISLAIPIIGMTVCIVIIVLWLNWNRLPMGWALGLTLFITLITIGIMRIVAEGGVYWFQFHTGAFHIYKIFAIGKYISAVVFAPIFLIYSILFVDMKTFLAPNLINSAKMQEDVRRNRCRFHINIVLCMVITVVVGLGFTIFLAHLRGGDNMNSWFYTSSPKLMMDESQSMIETQRTQSRLETVDPASNASPAQSDDILQARLHGSTVAWYGVGGGWVTLTMFLRRTLFWFPHPIGYVMLINPLMGEMWLSFFIGWMIKKLVVKYGGKATFDKAKVMCLGLIMGELMSIFVWTLMRLIFNFKLSSTLTLNRYGP